CHPVEAQQKEEIRRIGFLGGAFCTSNPARHPAPRRGVGTLRWVGGKNITIGYPFAGGNRQLLPKHALETPPSPVYLIVTGGRGALALSRKQTLPFPLSWGLTTIRSDRDSSPA